MSKPATPDLLEKATDQARSRPQAGTIRLEADAPVVKAVGAEEKHKGPVPVDRTILAQGPIIRAGAPGDDFANVRAQTLAHQSITLNGKEYEVREVLSMGKTGEADIFLVGTADGEFVLKRYRHVVPKLEIVEQLKQIDHPNIIKVIDYGMAKDQFCEVMELARGGTLDMHSPIAETKLFESVVHDLVSGFEACHERGIVHRDIKPANIFCRNPDGTGLMIADFGISSMLAAGNTRKVTIQCLTVSYAAPETFGVSLPGEEGRVVVGPAADFYSLGITLLEVYVGRSPFSDDMSAFEVSHLIRTGNVPLPEDLPPRVRDLIRGLITLNHLRRWGLDEVKRWLGGEVVPVLSEDHSHHERFPRFDFIRVEGRKRTASTPKEMALLLLEYPEQGKKHLYRGLISEWAGKGDQLLASALRDVTEEDFPQAPELGLMKAVYLLDPRHPFTTRGGTRCPVTEPFSKTLLSIGDAVEEERDVYLSELTEASHPDLFVYLDAIGHHQYVAELRRFVAESAPEAAFNKIVLQLQGSDGLKIGETLLTSFADIEKAGPSVQKVLTAMLHSEDSKFLVWLQEMGLKRDTRPICDSDLDEMVALVRQMPWLRSDKQLSSRLNQKDEVGWTELMKAAHAGHLPTCRELLSHGLAIDAEATSGATALTVAAAHNRVDVVRFLIEEGADPNRRNKAGQTPIHYVLESGEEGHVEALAALIDGGADVNAAKAEDGLTLLHIAVAVGHHDAVRLLLERGADPNLIEDNRDITPLFLAAGDGDVELIDLLVARGAAANARGFSGLTPLYFAADEGEMDAVRALLRHGADARLCDHEDGWGPLHAAVTGGHADIVRALIEGGADPNSRWPDKQTVLHQAVAGGHLEALRALLEMGAKPNVTNGPDRENKTPLRLAAKSARVEMVRCLLDHGANPNIADDNGFTPLHEPGENADSYDLEIVRLLLERGADTRKGTRTDKQTPIHFAIFDNQPEALALYLEKRKGLNVATSKGTTPLMLAATLRRTKMVRMLLEAGANHHLRDHDGDTAYDIAVLKKYNAIVRLLSEHKGSLLSRASGTASRLLLHGLRGASVFVVLYTFVHLAHHRFFLGEIGADPWVLGGLSLVVSYAMVGFFLLLGVERARRYMAPVRYESQLARLRRYFVRPVVPGFILLGGTLLFEMASRLDGLIPYAAVLPRLLDLHIVTLATGESLRAVTLLGSAGVALLVFAPLPLYWTHWRRM